MSPHADWPDDEEEAQLLAALHTGGPTAPNALAKRYLPLLVAFLRGRYPHASDDHLNGAADEALMSFLVQPARYDPARGPLSTYLRLSALGDLKNAFARDAKHRAVSLDSVADVPNPRNQIDATESPLADPRITAEVAALAPEERAVLELMCEGVRDTDEYAEELGLLHLSIEERRAEVKRTKDKLQKRLSRALGDRGDSR
jgi:DNA-directed RNA polymerase specialized sigma24 family protein